MAVPSRMIPAFFKLFNPDFCSQRLQIPSAFISKMNGKLPDNTAFLRNVFGNVWPVEVISERQNMCFKNGWVKFVKDNGVEPGDILVFHFDGGYFFDVKLFGKDACEKLEDFGSFQIMINLEEEEENVKTRNFKIGSKKKTGGCSVTGYKDVTSKNGSKGKAVVRDKVGSKDNVKEPDRRRRVDVFESGLISRPVNPYFIAHLKPSKRNEMNIPAEVIKDNNLEIPEEIIIIGEDGEEFHSKISTWEDGRKRLTNGWRAFRKWNLVRDEDTCLCEFVSNRSLFIRVLEFKGGKWMPKPRGEIPGLGY